MATTKFKQTNTPTPRPPLPAPLGQKLCGRMRRAGAGDEAAPRSGAGGDAAGVRAPRLGLASDALSRSGPKFLSREAAEWISFSNLFIYLFPRSRSPPSLSSPTPLHAFFLRPHSLLPYTPAFTPPPPRRLGEGRRCLSGFWA